MFFRLLLCATFLLYIGTPVAAQSNWQPAAVKIKNGLKLVGHIDDRRWGFRIKYIRFRPATSQEVIRYPIASLDNFSVGNRSYKVVDVAVNTSPRITRSLVRSERRTEEKSSKALMLLLSGPLSLYEYRDEESNSHFFVEEADQTLTYLEFAKYLVEERNSEFTYQEANTFRGTIRGIMDDCPKLRGEIAKAKYQKNALINLFKRYFSCTNDRADYELPPSEGGWTFGPDLGFLYSNPRYNLIDPAVIFFSGISSWDPIVGGHLRYRFSGLAADVAIRFGVQYHSFNIMQSKQNNRREIPSENNTLEYFFNERSLHLQLGPEAILVRSRYPVFLETAIHYHRIFDYQESRFNQRISNGVATATGLAYDFSNTNAFSLSIGAGVIIGDGRITIMGSATRRAYDTYILNLYRFGFVGSYDF